MASESLSLAAATMVSSESHCSPTTTTMPAAESYWPVMLFMGEPYSTILITLAVTYSVYLVKPGLRLAGQAMAKLSRLVRSTGEDAVETFEEDVVYLYMFPRSYTRQLLNLSPFAVKLESWLRLKKIPYKVVETRKFSKSTRQIPYIKINGEEIADSVFIIEYLIEKFKLDPLEGSTSEERGITRAFHRMADESLALTNFWFRYHILTDQFCELFRPFPNKFTSKKITAFLGESVNKRAVTSGMGRHTIPEVGIIGKDDVRALGRMLGDKKYMFGDTIRLLDCVAFAHLSHVLLIDVDFPHKQVLGEEDCLNLMPYMERMKTALWPDWDDIVNMQPFE